MATLYRYVVCVKNRGNSASLEVRKIYRAHDDASAESRGMLRVIDESGEDYLYPERYFVPIEVPRDVAKTFSNKSA